MKPTIRKGAVLGLTLGRGGSKGVPRKNVRTLGGHPLIAWAVAAGLASKRIDRVLCSTDDPEIAAVCRRYGADVPFMRPTELAGDFSTDMDVFSHALNWLEKNEGELPELVVQLRPTTPFRDPLKTDWAIESMLADTSITCMRSVAASPLTPYKMWVLQQSGQLTPLLTLPDVKEPFNLPRQALPVVHWHTGQIDIIRTETLLSGSMTGDNIHAIEMDGSTAVDIDEPVDFALAELEFERLMPASLITAISAAARLT